MPQPKPERDSWLCGEGVRKLSESNVVQSSLAPVLSGIAVALQGRGRSGRFDVPATVDRGYPNRIQRCWPLTRIIHEASAVSADTRLRRAVSPFSPSTYCTSMPQGFTSPSARLASRLHAFATNFHE
jgi:hypothetical protein